MNVFVYVDALPFDSISYESTPFIKKLVDEGHNYVLQNIMGYSFGIQSAMMSGKLPSVTKQWMPYVYASSSNLRSLRALAPLARRANVDVSESRFLRTIRYGVTSRLFLRNGAKVSSIPWSVADRFYVYPYYYMNELPSFIELEKELSTTVGSRLLYFGPSLHRKGATDYAVKYIRGLIVEPNSAFSRTLLFIYVDVLDHRGHGYGVGSRIWDGALTKVDRDLRNMHEALEEKVGSFTFSLFSDHGMCNVERTIDILKPLRIMGLNWKDSTIFVDATIVNIWIEKQTSRRSLLKTLESVGQGRFIILDKEEDADTLREVGVPLDGRCYGDLIIQARPGYMFFPNYYSDIKSFKGVHGYFPNESCQASFLNMNRNAEKDLSVRPTHVKDIRRLLLSLAAVD